MKVTVINFGSVNIDHVYRVPHFVRPGETLSCAGYARCGGGKGANQSIALAFAGATVKHAGRIGTDGLWLKERLEKYGVGTSHLQVVDAPTGHAVIQVNPAGENAIIIHGGANMTVTAADAAAVLKDFSAGDFLLVQNEISAVPAIIERAARAGLRVFFNPAPMRPEVLSYPLDLIDCFIINEIEGEQLTGEREPSRIVSAMRSRLPRATSVLTLGAEGVLYADERRELRSPAEKVEPVDTTAAGDTFIGYFVAEIAAGSCVEDALRIGCKAAGICVTRPGAADSIPRRSELSGL